jgi:probable HAF family extracellular repeat protein
LIVSRAAIQHILRFEAWHWAQFSNSVSENFSFEGLIMTTTYQYQTIDPPGSESSGAKAINSRGQIIGSYVDGIGLEHGFLDSNGVYTTIDNPGSTETVLDGINSKGQIIGQSGVNAPDEQSFLYSGGTYTNIDFPGSTNTGVSNRKVPQDGAAGDAGE